MMMRAYSTVEATRCDPPTTDLLSGQTVGILTMPRPASPVEQLVLEGVLPCRKWSRLGESNPRPTHYECVALPAELRRLVLASPAEASRTVAHYIEGTEQRSTRIRGACPDRTANSTQVEQLVSSWGTTPLTR
jgi:hypothetical protein